MELNGHWGFKNSPQILQRVMNSILSEFRGNGVEVYMDYIVVHAKTIRDHDMKLNWVLERVNIGKLQLREKRVKLLGVTINGKVQEANEIKKSEALEYPSPRTITELRRFLGLTGCFREFINDYSTLMFELSECLKCNKKELGWNENLEKKFTKAKDELKKIKELMIPDYNKEFVFKANASSSGMGSALWLKNKRKNLCQYS